MITNLYAIYDSKAKIYNAPFSLINDQVALRSATQMANDPSTQCCKNPEDFTIFSIGTYDDQTAQIKVSEKQTCLAKFITLKNQTD